MSGQYRIVSQLPLERLWDDTGTDMRAVRVRHLDDEELRALLRTQPLRFVLANVGHPLRWLDRAERFKFWKAEVQPHLFAATRVYLEDYPGGYYYNASEWHLADSPLIVLLEMVH